MRHDHLDSFLRHVAYARVSYVIEAGAVMRNALEIRYIKELAPDLNVIHRPVNVPLKECGRADKYAEFSRTCGLPVTKEGYIPLDDYARWILGAEPYFAEEFVLARVMESIAPHYSYCAESKDKDVRKYILPEYLDHIIYEIFWERHKEPQHEVPNFDRRRKPTP